MTLPSLPPASTHPLKEYPVPVPSPLVLARSRPAPAPAPRSRPGFHPCGATTLAGPCPEQVSAGHVACRDHWMAVPGHLRHPLVAAFRLRETDPAAFDAARAEARRLVDAHALDASVPR